MDIGGIEVIGTGSRLITAEDVAEVTKHIEQLESENAKLREYAKLMHTHIKVCCDACGECGFCDIDAITRELGIEVDE